MTALGRQLPFSPNALFAGSTTLRNWEFDRLGIVGSHVIQCVWQNRETAVTARCDVGLRPFQRMEKVVDLVIVQNHARDPVRHASPELG
ncbi:MAG: hypothetical protein AAF999_02200 [Pseudomonadota bacterium]